jgi:hypothetical protein
MERNHSGDFRPFEENATGAYVQLTTGAAGDSRSGHHANKVGRRLAKRIRQDGWNVVLKGDVLQYKA